jgi:molybdenum cofactor biosynthesis protein B
MNATQTLGCAVIGVTDKSDDAAQLIRKLLLDAGCEVPHFSVVSEKQSCRAIIFVGGSEISPRGSTVGALLGMFEQRIEGFGELFRHVIYEQFGSKAVLVRAAAGIYRGRIVLSVPTSASFVQLGMEKLILPELGNMVAQIAPRL